MSLNDADLSVLTKWFLELQLYQDQPVQYQLLRDKIYKFLYEKLADLLVTKTYEWNKAYALTEEDSISIFNDILLNCVEKYNPKKGKFITYLWCSCDNSAKNYYKKYRVQRRIPQISLVNVDFSNLNEEEAGTQYAPEVGTTTTVLSQLRNTYDEDSQKEDLTNYVAECVEDLETRLSADETIILKDMMDGNTIAAISKNSGMAFKEVSKHLRSIRKKARTITQRHAR